MPNEDQRIEILTNKLEALENESRRVLGAMRWASRVRIMLLAGLVLFVLVFGFLFYRLYDDIRERRIAQVQLLVNENPEDFYEPLTRQVILLAEERGPEIAEVFRQQIEADSGKYVAAFDYERDTFIQNMEQELETRLETVYQDVMDEHEAILKKEFPDLVDRQKLQMVRDNMQSIYTQVGKRYYVDFMGDRLREIVGKLDTFPATTPRQPGIPLGEQIATEMLELVRMMVIYSENYVPPEDEETMTASATTSSAIVPDDQAVDPGPSESTEPDESGSDGGP